jgi:leucyl-tRNA synthetase
MIKRNMKKEFGRKKVARYDHIKIESKWQKFWTKEKPYEVKISPNKKKFYALMEFPYPSGDGLHVGHVRGYTAMDIISRQKRMSDNNTLYPIGWDAFGLPTENYAIKTGKQPKLITKRNTDNFRKQFNSLGMSFDWSREIDTTDPAYYRWTQWIFLQFFKKGLAYKKKVEINWCIDCKIGLANEEVVDNCCERCGGQVIKKEKDQWMLGITKYADRLDKDLDLVDYPQRVKLSQRNWIGRSEGSLIKFKVKSYKIESIENPLYELEKLDKLSTVEVFTTRADTLFGATYLVLAPEHPIITNYKLLITNWGEVEGYIKKVKNKTDLERTENKEKTGVELKGIKAINFCTNEEIPVWVADYVLPHYGTGAVMAVPAHDERDFEFAKKFNLEIKEVVSGGNIENQAFTDDGKLINSGSFNGLHTKDAIKKITDFVGGKMVTKYKLRDWVFSRQRYWGEPIPLVFCEHCVEQVKNKKLKIESEGERLNPGWFMVADKDLPVKLPEVKNYKPTDTGESPLASISKWVNVKCPKCKGPAKRETDTMPNWAGSSWYYLRYTDPKNKKEFASQKNLKYWLGEAGGVDWYNGGMEHTTLHLLYSRFWHKFLYDLKLVPTIEPYQKRTSHGMILAEGGVKMSKSKGNVINPDDIVRIYGADTLRIYEMFIGPFEDTVAWNTESIIGSRRFLERVWRVGHTIITNEELKIKNDKNFQKLLNKTIKKVTEDIESMSFNTAISSMMILVNKMESAFAQGNNVTRKDFKMFLQVLAPFAPHITEELYQLLINNDKLQNKKTNTKKQIPKSIHQSSWPKWDDKEIQEDEIKIAIQINGRVRSEITINRGLSEKEVKEIVIQDESLINWLKGKEIKRFIYVPGKIINIVI